jgi:CheY-like chemotaxis protein
MSTMPQNAGFGRPPQREKFFPALPPTRATLAMLNARLSKSRTCTLSPMVPDDRPREFARLDGVHILVVDDNADARTIYRNLLTYAGASVLVVGSATAAARALRHVRPDVVVSDLSMPRRDGLWLIDWIRKRDTQRGEHIPVIAVTARDDLYPERSPELKRFDGYLTKPVAPLTLFATIRRFLGPANAQSRSVASA